MKKMITGNNNNGGDDDDDDNKKSLLKIKESLLKYSSMYTFNKYKTSELDKLISLESKFNYINEFAQKLNKLYQVKPRNDTNKAKKEEVCNDAGKRLTNY